MQITLPQSSGGLSRSELNEYGISLADPQFGLVMDGVADDSAALQSAIDFVEALPTQGQVKSVLSVPPASKIKINSGITIDVSRCGINFGGSRIDATGIATGVAMTVTTTADSNARLWSQSLSSVDNFVLSGADVAGVVAVRFVNNVGVFGAAYSAISRAVIHNFDVAIGFDDNAYLNILERLHVYACGLAIDGQNYTNSGERLVIKDSIIATCVKVFNFLDPESDVYFQNTSFDFNGWLGDIVSGRVEFTGCHIENSGGSTIQLNVSGSGGGASFNGGEIIYSSTAPQYTSWATASLASSIDFNNVFMNNLRSTTSPDGPLVAGAGMVRAEKTRVYSTSNLPVRLSDERRNSLIRGDFEAAAQPVPRLIWANGSTTNRLSGTNITIARSVAQFDSGAASLAITKPAGGTAGFVIAVPVSHGQIPSMRIRAIDPGAVAGDIFVTYLWRNVRLSIDDTHLETLDEESIASGVLYTLTASWADRITLAPDNTRKAPAWANYFYALFNINAMAAGTIYFDNVTINTW